MNCNYKECLKHFVRICEHHDCRLRFEICSDIIKIYYYYNDDELFDVDKDIYLDSFLKSVNSTD